MPALATGTTLKHGTFEVVSYLGRGGFGEVYLAQQTRVKRDVAIKVLLPHVSENADVVARFQREALAAANLQHPNVLTVFDFDFDEEVRAWFLAMQFVPGGKTLRDLLGSPRSLGEVLPFAEGIAGALDAAHARGIVHRDVKPENVLLDGQRPLLADFGIAHLATMTSMTATGFAVGTPAYMSPEQAAGKPVSPKSDQYALSVIVYEMLAGRPPFIGDPVSLILQHANAVPPPLASFNPQVTAAARAAILLAMSKNPDDRYESCLEWVHELQAARGSASLTPAASTGQVDVTGVETPPPPPVPEDVGQEPPAPELQPDPASADVGYTDGEMMPTVSRPLPTDPLLATAAGAEVVLRAEEDAADRTVARAFDEPTTVEEAEPDHTVARAFPEATAKEEAADLTGARALDELTAEEEAASDRTVARAFPDPTAVREPEPDSVLEPEPDAGFGLTIARPIPTPVPELNPEGAGGAGGALPEAEPTPEPEAPFDGASGGGIATAVRSTPDGLAAAGAAPEPVEHAAGTAATRVPEAPDVAPASAVGTDPVAATAAEPVEATVGEVASAPLAAPAEPERASGVPALPPEQVNAEAEVEEADATTWPPRPIAQPTGLPEPGQRRGGLRRLRGRKALMVSAMAGVAAACATFLIARPGPFSGPVTGELTPVVVAENPVAVPEVGTEPPPDAVARGTVHITSRPPGGIVSVNGEPAGRAPGLLSLRPGAYEVLVSVPSYRDWVRRVDIAGDESLTLDAELAPLPAVEVLEVGDFRMGREPYLDASGLMRIGSLTDTFVISDDVNAVVYLRPKSFSIRDLTFAVVSRWQRSDGLPPIEQQAEQRVLSDWDETFVRACAPALALDSRGSNAPLNLEMAIDGVVVARFSFRVGPGNPANASSNPCNPSQVPSRVASRR